MSILSILLIIVSIVAGCIYINGVRKYEIKPEKVPEPIEEEKVPETWLHELENRRKSHERLCDDYVNSVDCGSTYDQYVTLMDRHNELMYSESETCYVWGDYGRERVEKRHDNDMFELRLITALLTDSNAEKWSIIHENKSIKVKEI